MVVVSLLSMAQEEQHPPVGSLACIGGHGTLPYEQYTQQSPNLGRSTRWQPAHSKKNWQASVGMISWLTRPQSGQVSVESSVGAAFTWRLPSRWTGSQRRQWPA